ADGSIVSLLQLKLAPSRLMRLVEGGPPRPACLLETAPDRDPVIWAYERPATTWHTVTPVVLHGHNSEHGKFSPKKTSALLLSAFAKAGFTPEQIEELFYQPAPFWPGTGAAFAFKTPAHLNQWPRYHVGVRFREPVQGPLLIGIGQHYGIGLFAAADSPASARAAGATPSR
ncbi:MAG: type I-G CRISPR-associated protein Csb2, partial [Terriglobales bacterium]